MNCFTFSTPDTARVSHFSLFTPFGFVMEDVPEHVVRLDTNYTGNTSRYIA